MSPGSQAPQPGHCNLVCGLVSWVVLIGHFTSLGLSLVCLIKWGQQ